jgi:competence protein ComEC
MQDLVGRPLVCITLAFAGGIALAGAVGPGMLAVVSAVAACAGVLWAFSRRSGWMGIVILAIAAVAGGALALAGRVMSDGDVSQLPSGGQTLVGTVAGQARYSRGTWRFVLTAEEHVRADACAAVTGRVYVRMKSSKRVERGQRWRLTGKLRPVRETANPGQRSEAARLESLAATAVLVVGAEELGEMLGPGELGLVAGHAYRAQKQALAMLARHVRGPYAELAAGVAASVIFGVYAAPPPGDIVEVFRRAGTIHLLVVSGGMVSMVFGMVFLPGMLGAGWRRMRVDRQFGWAGGRRGRISFQPGLVAAVLAVLVATYYAVLTEGGQAVARAAVMGVIGGAALALRRVPPVAREHGLNVDRYTLLAGAGLVILVASPNALFQPGFQLSFAAVWCILYLTPKAMWLLGWLPQWAAYTLAGTVAAQLATFPILVWHYGQAPLAGFGANLLAVPLAGIVLVAGMATCALDVMAPFAASLAGWATGLTTRWLVWVSAAFASLPGASVEVARPSPVIIVGWFVGLIVLGWGLGRVGTTGRLVQVSEVAGGKSPAATKVPAEREGDDVH